ncbi:MAG: hypothetical protein PHQ23_09825 [Candidatus Wallbacteria bacterium]|nr:hypothetical protein [Candidatus Wallbacteria bacterium]
MKKIILAVTLALLTASTIGCGGSSLGETGISHYSDLPSQELTDAWYVFNKGNPYSSKTKFEQVLRMNVTDVQKSSAYAGIAFAVAKQNGILESYPYFEKALELDSSNRDAKVGMAGYYLSLADKTFFSKGISYLESMGVNSTSKVFIPDNNAELTDMSVHALLGLLYYYNGNYNDGIVLLKYAKYINEPDPEVDIKQVTDAFLSGF